MLLPQCVSTLTRRKAAGTLLPGGCRATEMAWRRIDWELNLLQKGTPIEQARAFALALARELGFDAYLGAAIVALKVLVLMERFSMSRTMQLSHAALVASALELMAEQRELPSVILDNGDKAVLRSSIEVTLAQYARLTLLDARMFADMDSEAVMLMVNAWRRVERSGAVTTRKLNDDAGLDTSDAAGFHAAAAEAAVRGLHECALAGCASKEVHVSQFKKCGACRTVSYCCREHQVADWPAHKAACKATRKADPAGASGA